MNLPQIARDAYEKQNFCLSPPRSRTGNYCMLLILATGFSEFKLLHVLYKWPALYQVPVVIVYAPVYSVKTNVVFFFSSANSKELWHWQDDNFIQHSEDSNLSPVLPLWVKMLFPFRRAMQADENGCS